MMLRQSRSGSRFGGHRWEMILAVRHGCHGRPDSGCCALNVCVDGTGRLRRKKFFVIFLCAIGNSIQNLAPLIFKPLNILDSKCTVEGIRFYWSDASMLRKIRLVPSYQNILKFLPFQHEKAVMRRLFEHHQNAYQVRKRLRLALSDILVLAIESDIRKLADIELPVQTVNRLHLHGHMAAGLTRRNYVVMWNVASEWRCKKSAAAQLRGYEEFSNRACQLSGSTCCHSSDYQATHT